MSAINLLSHLSPPSSMKPKEGELPTDVQHLILKYLKLDFEESMQAESYDATFTATILTQKKTEMGSFITKLAQMRPLPVKELEELNSKIHGCISLLDLKTNYEITQEKLISILQKFSEAELKALAKEYPDYMDPNSVAFTIYIAQQLISFINWDSKRCKADFVTGRSSYQVPDILVDCRPFFKAAAASEKGYGIMFHASERLQKDRDLVLLASQWGNGNLAELALNDKEIILTLISKTYDVEDLWEALRVSNSLLLQDPEVILAIIKKAKKIYLGMERMNLALFDNQEFALKLVQEDGKYLKYLSPRLKDNKELVLAALHQISFGHGNIIHDANPRFKSDKEVVLAALRKKANVQLVSEDLQKDPEVIAEIKLSQENARQKEHDAKAALKMFFGR